jgi:hypothetical protein
MYMIITYLRLYDTREENIVQWYAFKAEINFISLYTVIKKKQTVSFK